jgi:type III restriction enzyme
MANGERCRIDRLNRLTVVASETFEKYAAGLQREMQAETGESFAGAIVNARKRREVKLKDNFETIPGFKELWDHIAPRTRYELDFNTQDLIDEATLRLERLGRAEPIKRPRIVTKRVELEMVAGQEIQAGAASAERYVTLERQVKVHDILGELQGQLPVSRSTIAKVITESGRLQEALVNPAQFASQVKRVIQQSLSQTIVHKKGIKYFPLVGEGSKYLASFVDNESYDDNIVTVTKSIYDSVIVDSGVERRFAEDLDKRDDVELFIKLPDWFKIPTPIGNYNPDWAIVRKLDSGEKRVYLVRETKGTTDIDALRFEGEGWKIEFGRQHFIAIEVDYKVASMANQLDVDIPFKLENAE